MKKSYALVIGLLSGIVTVLAVDQLIKGLLAYIFIGPGVHIYFSGIRFDVNFPVNVMTNFFLYALIVVSPFLMSLLLIEISLLVLGKISSDFARSSIIVFQLINIGYLIFAAVIGILSILIQTTFQTDWSTLLNHGGLSYNQKLIFMFFVLFLLLVYINILTKRIRRAIPVIRKIKQ